MTADPHHERRWLILAALGLAQLVVILDVTVVNIALPSAQDALGFSDGDRQWIVTAYTLSFGGLLLLAGRVADLAGRKRTLLVGLVGFALASALGGTAQSFAMLVAARALQGMFGALLAPSALSLLTTTFTDPAERSRAFGVFGRARIAAGGIDCDVTLEDADRAVLDAVDAAYRDKYGRRYAQIVDSITDAEHRATTLRLLPQHAA
jgi:predicted MFS family arabinose efflux permease